MGRTLSSGCARKSDALSIYPQHQLRYTHGIRTYTLSIHQYTVALLWNTVLGPKQKAARHASAANKRHIQSTAYCVH
jgi:hypothetical protein